MVMTFEQELIGDLTVNEKKYDIETVGWKDTASIDFYKALVKAKLAFKPITKDKVNPHFKNQYASLDAILNATEEALLINGLVMIFTPCILDDRQYLIAKLLYAGDGSYTEGTFLLEDTKKAQQIGSAFTYARRYIYCAMLNIVADEDDDGNAAQGLPSKTDVKIETNLGKVKEKREKLSIERDVLMDLAIKNFPKHKDREVVVQTICENDRETLKLLELMDEYASK